MLKHKNETLSEESEPTMYTYTQLEDEQTIAYPELIL